MPDLQQIILDEVKEMRTEVVNNGTRITALEIEVRNLGKRANGFNGYISSVRWSRTDWLKFLGVSGGWVIGFTTIILAALKVI